jgi:hypothetical protein
VCINGSVLEPFIAFRLVALADLAPDPLKCYRFALLRDLLIGIGLVVDLIVWNLLVTGTSIVCVKCGAVLPSIMPCVSKVRRALTYMSPYLGQFWNDLI